MPTKYSRRQAVQATSPWESMPHTYNQKHVHSTLGESSQFRNPFRLPEMGKEWPKTERIREYGKILGGPDELVRKGEPI
jgi:hypothetical protein